MIYGELSLIGALFLAWVYWFVFKAARNKER